ncbi:MAG TPA: NAD(P)H-binding protein [Bacillota bacterium]|nr:NAD(P)H-binding protein [Bacillota bacterium]
MMHIFLLGGTGRVGSHILQFALNQGYKVSALARYCEERNYVQHPNLTWFYGNALQIEDIDRGMRGADVVISALSTDGTITLSQSIPLILHSMNQHHINRMITIGTAGILSSRSDSTALRYETGESNRKLVRATKEHHKVYLALEDSEVDYTIVCPTHMPDGERLGTYRTEAHYLPKDGKKIHVPDVADLAFKLLESSNYHRIRIGIAY